MNVITLEVWSACLQKKHCLTAFFPRGMGHGSSPSSDQVCTAHRQNLGKIRWFTESHPTWHIPRWFFALISWWTFPPNFPQFRCLNWKSLDKIYFVPGKATKKDKVDRHRNRFEMFQACLWYSWWKKSYQLISSCSLSYLTLPFRGLYFCISGGAVVSSNIWVSLNQGRWWAWGLDARHLKGCWA